MINFSVYFSASTFSNGIVYVGNFSDLLCLIAVVCVFDESSFRVAWLAHVSD